MNASAKTPVQRKSRLAFAAALALACLALASPVLAAAAAGGEEKVSLFAGDVGSAVWTLAIFLLALFVLGKYAWGPILEGLQKREDFIAESLEKAAADRDAAETRLAEYEKQIANARAEATEIVEEGKRDGDALREKIEAKAREEADQMVERAKREIAIAKETAIKDLYVESAQLATSIAGRIVGRELEAKDHERLIRESLEELGRAEAN